MDPSDNGHRIADRPEKTGGRYPSDLRIEALAIYQEKGPSAAERETGIPIRTISRWAEAAGLTTEVTVKTQAAADAARAQFALRREELRTRLLDQALAVLGRVTEPYQDFVGQQGREVSHDLPPASAVRDLSVSVGILIDKLRLELGEHTGREAVDHRFGSLSDEEIDDTLRRILSPGPL